MGHAWQGAGGDKRLPPPPPMEYANSCFDPPPGQNPKYSPDYGA